MKRIPDASFASAVFIPSQAIPGAMAVIQDAIDELVAPDILRQEFLHLLLGVERRRLAPATSVASARASFSAVPIRYYHSNGWVDRAYELSRELGTGLFDTIYLVAAEDLDAELWTLDQRFLRALGGRYAGRVRTLT